MTKGYSFQLKEDQPHFNIARLVVSRPSQKHQHFEVVVEPELAIKFRNGVISDVRDVLRSIDIFTDSKKGLRPSESDLRNVFGTTDKIKIAEEIIRKGIIQVSDKYREEQREAKRKRIMEIIHRNCVDSKTGLPHPLQRIENAMRELKVRIDDTKSAEDQVNDVITKLRQILPIKFETREIELNVPMKYASRAVLLIRQYATIKSQTWNTDGSFNCVIELPAGMQQEFFDRINSLTHGEVGSKIIGSR